MMINNTACFTAHRNIGNYSFKSSEAHLLRDKLMEPLGVLVESEGIDTFVSGGAIGGDQIAFFSVHLLKKKYPHIKNVVAVPFQKQYTKWSDENVRWYNKMLNLADEVVYVDTVEGYTDPKTRVGDFSVAKLHIRNHYMVDNSRVLIAIYDGSKGGTQNCYNYALKNNKTIYRLNPKSNFEYTIESKMG